MNILEKKIRRNVADVMYAGKIRAANHIMTQFLFPLQ